MPASFSLAIIDEQKFRDSKNRRWISRKISKSFKIFKIDYTIRRIVTLISSLLRVYFVLI